MTDTDRAGPRNRLHLPRRHHGPRVTTDQARSRLRSLATGARPSRGQVVAAMLLALLGIALVAQVRSTDEAGLRQLRQAELVALLDNVTGRVDALQQEVVQLEADRLRLQGEQGGEAAAVAAAERLESYAILAGTVPVQGPGVTIYVNDPEGGVTQTMMLDAIQELRDAGAEAIQIGAERVVASTWVGTDAEGRVTLDGAPLVPPYRIVAIGDSHTLAAAMAIPGGFSDSLRGVGATVNVVEDDDLLVDALHPAQEPRYARPVPSAPE
ncbi:DUF881 domain-containing protein [Ornithinimicrobium humiphilum]|uniref:Uncharacterized protein YlxW (UPF0749 family) n=1 Tax=Ornithinimicrobium humiphilum TaxID=125288 RepID=A0A543KNX8_9MICO|nr:DUF881 domain-containing protein [Ornithinimicrobium humiphilum]TQM96770.1 uncharacterized protein YlxW (UPF0749 family) [Ornithinimicrobium humiphilum]